jgi:hypothetical protein
MPKEPKTMSLDADDLLLVDSAAAEVDEGRAALSASATVCKGPVLGPEEVDVDSEV